MKRGLSTRAFPQLSAASLGHGRPLLWLALGLAGCGPSGARMLQPELAPSGPASGRMPPVVLPPARRRPGGPPAAARCPRPRTRARPGRRRPSTRWRCPLPAVDAAPRAGASAGRRLRRGRSACASGHCVDGVCCADACASPCQQLRAAPARPGGARRSRPARTRTATARSSRRRCAVSTGPATGRAPAGVTRAAPSARPAAAPATTSWPARVCDGNGVCLPAQTRSCAPTVCRQDSCAGRCTAGHRLPERILLRRRHLPAQAAARSDLRRQRAVRAPAPASTASAATAPAPSAARPATWPGAVGRCTRRPRGPGPRRPSVPPRTRPPAGATALATARAAAACTPPGPCARRRVCTRADRDLGARPATGGARAAARHHRRLRRLRLRGGACGTILPGRRPAAAPGFVCNGTVCAEAGLAPLLEARRGGRRDRDRLVGQRVRRHLPGRAEPARAVGSGRPAAALRQPAQPRLHRRRRAGHRAGQPCRRGCGPPTALTLSVWYRATAVDTGGGGELISLGNNTLLRVRTADVDVSKRVPDGAGGAYARCFGAAPATSTATGTTWRR